MKKLLLSLLLIAGITMTATTFAGNVIYKYNLPENDSSKVRTTPKLTGADYMKALHSVSLVNVPVNAKTAVLTTTLDKKGTTKANYLKNTYTVTVGYTSCKVDNYVSRKELPKTITVDLTNVKCLNKTKPVNFLPLLQSGARMNVFFAKINGTTHDTVVRIK